MNELGSTTSRGASSGVQNQPEPMKAELALRGKA